MLQVLVDLWWVVLSPALFLGVYYHVLLPGMSFTAYYSVALGVVWWVSGLAYLTSMLVPVKNTLVAGAQPQKR